MISDAASTNSSIEQSNNRTIEQSNNLVLTLKSWLIVTLLTIGLCYLTQLVGGWLGFDLKEQATIDQMRKMGLHTWQALTGGDLKAAFGDKVVLAFLLNLPMVLALMPIVEEFIFRFLLFKLPARRWAPAAVAVASAALFSAAHYIQMPWPNNAFLALGFFGLAQCWLYRKTDRIWCPMLNHSLFNLTNLVLLFVIPE